MILVYLSVLFFILNFLIRQSKWFKVKYHDVMRLSPINSCIEIYNTGSTSSKYAFDYNSIGINGLNAAMSPQSLEFDHNLLVKLIDNIKPNGIVIITICPFSSILDRYDNRSSNDKYYFILDKNQIDGYSTMRYIYIKLLYITPLIDIFIHPSLLKQIIAPVKDNARFTTNKMSSEELNIDAKKWIKCWQNEFKIPDLDHNVSLKHYDTMRKNQQIVLDMINICKENNIKPVIVIPPYTKYLENYLSEAVINKYVYDFLSPIKQKTDIRILSYQNDDILTDKDNYFNSFFFNKKGASLFTKKVVTQVMIDNNDRYN